MVEVFRGEEKMVTEKMRTGIERTVPLHLL